MTFNGALSSSSVYSSFQNATSIGFSHACAMTSSSHANFRKANRLIINEKGEISIRQKTPAEVVGEKVLKPIIDRVQSLTSMIWNLPGRVSKAFTSSTSTACATQLAVGALGTVAIKNPAPVAVGVMGCLTGTKAAKSEDIVKADEADAEEIRQYMQKLFDEGQHAEVIREGNELIKLGQADPTTHFIQGLSWKHFGNVERAHKSFREALKDSQYALNKLVQEVDGYTKNEAKLHQFKVNFLNAISMNVPDHYDYVTMSGLAYYERNAIESSVDNAISSKKIGIKDEERSVLAHFWGKLKDKNWVILNTSKDFGFNENGYYAIAFKNSVTGHIIIAHRGSADLYAIVNDMQILGNREPDQYQEAVKFINKIEQIHPDVIISHTGHSLGAVLAELWAYRNHRIAVTVDSPGIVGTVYDKFFTRGKIFPHIVTYFSHPNIVNACCGEHLGEQRTVSPLVKQPSSLTGIAGKAIWQYLSSFVETKAPKDIMEFVNQLKKDVEDYHNVFNILLAFDHKTGGATNYRAVEKWPKAPGERIKFEEICVKHNLAIAAPESMDSNVMAKLEAVYQTETPNEYRIPLSLFSDEAQALLQNGEYYTNQNSYLMSLFEIQGGDVVIRSDSSIFTIQQFKNYVEHKVVEGLAKGLNLAPTKAKSNIVVID